MSDQDAPKRHDETVPGGRYLLADGTWVDAEGKPIKGPSKAEQEPQSTPAAPAAPAPVAPAVPRQAERR